MTKQMNHRHWQAHVKAQQQSGLSRAEYCRQHNLSYHALTYWQKKFARPSSSSATTLVPVSLRTEPVRKVFYPELQLILPGKISVAVGDNFSPATLSKLLTVLENR